MRMRQTQITALDELQIMLASEGMSLHQISKAPPLQIE